MRRRISVAGQILRNIFGLIFSTSLTDRGSDGRKPPSEKDIFRWVCIRETPSPSPGLSHLIGSLPNPGAARMPCRLGRHPQSDGVGRGWGEPANVNLSLPALWAGIWWGPASLIGASQGASISPFGSGAPHWLVAGIRPRTLNAMPPSTVSVGKEKTLLPDITPLHVKEATKYLKTKTIRDGRDWKDLTQGPREEGGEPRQG